MPRRDANGRFVKSTKASPARDDDRADLDPRRARRVTPRVLAALVARLKGRS